MADAVELIRPPWPASANVRAVATTRAGGVSAGVYRSLNLATHVGDDAATVAENRRRLRSTLSLSSEPLWLEQVHGTRVADAGDFRNESADAIVASAAAQVCAVLTADCLPVLFCDRSGQHVAAAHAGWRGLAAGVLEATVSALRARGVRPQELMAWIGPAISAAAYEVGDDVREAFLTADPDAAAGFTRNARGRWQLDLAGLARQRLAAAGVSQVFGGDICTHTDRRFFSYRRDGECGRQATLIWIAGGCQPVE